MTHDDNDPRPKPSTQQRPRERALAAGLYRRARVRLGMTQAEAAERGHCGERSQRDRELGDCNLGALESLVAMAASMGRRLVLTMVPVGHVEPENDNAAPPSLRPVGLAKCEAVKPARRASRNAS